MLNACIWVYQTFGHLVHSGHRVLFAHPPLVNQGLLQVDLPQDCSGHSKSVSTADKGANCEEKHVIETWYVRYSNLVGCGTFDRFDRNGHPMRCHPSKESSKSHLSSMEGVANSSDVGCSRRIFFSITSQIYLTFSLKMQNCIDFADCIVSFQGLYAVVSLPKLPKSQPRFDDEGTGMLQESVLVCY